MQDVHANNLIESWHNVLKSVYLKETRKQRTDLLVHRLLNEVLNDLRKKVTQISLGFQSRRTNLAEGKQHDLCRAIPDEVALNLVCRSFSSENIDGLETKLKKKSLSDPSPRKVLTMTFISMKTA